MLNSNGVVGIAGGAGVVGAIWMLASGDPGWIILGIFVGLAGAFCVAAALFRKLE